MGLAAGTKLGSYEILASLGAGGMGEVYRASDPPLGRDVAIKILPDLFASDPDRLRRFEQEARAVGALNHPNILAVHDLGVQAGTHYIVIEFLQGETLRQKVESGPLMPRRATEYAVQIARGLAAAHEKGIVHRDLKPENLFITSDSRIKILDFGLAKPVSVVEAGAEAPTVASDQTTGGVVLGTVGYMAPEQVRGEAVDARTDIFAFGAVLYEMLSGQRAFQRHSSVETMAAILKEDPPDLPASEERKIPPALDRILRRCLEKSPSQRFQSSKDLSFALENVDPLSSRQQAIHPIPPTQNRWRPASFALALIAVAAALVAGWEFLTRPQQPTYQQLTFRNGTITSARFGVNGETVVYAATWDPPRTKLYSSRLNETEVRALDLPPSDLLAVARVENGTCRLEYPIGKVLYETIGWISDMRVSPHGDAIAFMEHPFRADDRGSVVLVDLLGHKRVLSGEWSGEQGLAWSPEGREIWFTATNSFEWNRSLYAVTRSGKQRMILSSPGGLWLEDIASDGRVLLTRQARRYEVHLSHVGGESRELSWLQVMVASSVSRSGKFAVLGDWGTSTNYGVYLVKLDGSPPVLLGSGVSGAISPDDKWVTSILPSDASRVLLLPTGPGETKTVTAPNFAYRSAPGRVTDARWSYARVNRAIPCGSGFRVWTALRRVLLHLRGWTVGLSEWTVRTT